MHFLQSPALLGITLIPSCLSAPLNESTTTTLSKSLEDGQYPPSSGGTYTGSEGTYLTSDSVHHYASGVKCWTDLAIESPRPLQRRLRSCQLRFYKRMLLRNRFWRRDL